MKPRAPLNFPDREPISNSGGGIPLSQITAGSDFWDVFAGGRASGLPFMNEQAALTVSAIYACVSLIAGAIACLPLNVYRRAPDGEIEQQPSDDLWWILNEQMLPRWSAADGWEFGGQSKLIRGDSFYKIHRTPNGTVTGLEPLHYDRVQPIPTPDGRRLIYAVAPDFTVPGASSQQTQILDQDDVLHIPGFGFNGVRGLSPLRHHLRMTGSVAMSAQEYSARFFANGARPDYVLATDGKVSPTGIEELRKQVDERHRGLEAAHRPMVLTEGLKPHALGLPAEEMQLLGTRKFQIEEICRVYGVPPFMVGDTSNTAWVGTGIATLGSLFVRYTLNVHLNKIAKEINRKIFRTAAKIVRHDVTGLKQADFKSLIEAFRNALGRAGEQPVMTTEEVRQILNLPRTPKYGTLERNPGNASPAPAEPAGA